MIKKLDSYILNDHFNNIWTFTRNDVNELYYDVYNNQRIKIHSAVLSKDCSDDFVVNIGEHHDIHIVVKNLTGDILYYFFNGKKWGVVKLFNIGQFSDFFQLLGVYHLHSKTHILYCVQSTSGVKRWLFIDQYWENKKWNHIKISESSIAPLELEYSSVQDQQGNISLVYKAWEGKESYLQFCQFFDNVGLWNKSTLTFNHVEKYSPIILLTEQELHIAWTSFDENNYSIYIRSKNRTLKDGNQWKKEQILYSTKNKIHHLFVAEIKGKLNVLWYENGNLLSIESSDEGAAWNTHPIVYPLEEADLYYYLCRDIQSNTPYILLDKANNRFYPIDLYSLDHHPDISPSVDDSFYPSTLSKESIMSNKTTINNEKTFPKKKSSYHPTRSNMNISIESIKSLDDSTITNLSEEKAKVYLKILRGQLIHLYNEYNKIKNYKGSQLHSPTILEKKKIEDKNAMKERLRAKIIENENINLKSEVSDYKKSLNEVQLDIIRLREEINYMNEKNKRLQYQLDKIQDHSIGRKISKFFRGE